jgi:hypothetical protein
MTTLCAAISAARLRRRHCLRRWLDRHYHIGAAFDRRFYERAHVGAAVEHQIAGMNAAVASALDA